MYMHQYGTALSTPLLMRKPYPEKGPGDLTFEPVDIMLITQKLMHTLSDYE